MASTQTDLVGQLDADLSFLAAPEKLADWRLVLAYEAAAEAGVLDELPASLAQLAARCGLDQGALRAVLGQLAAWGIVTQDGEGRFTTGSPAPSWPRDAMLLRHAAVIRRWATLLSARLHDRTATSGDDPARARPTDLNLELLAVHQRRLVGPVIDICLQRFPATARVLDLGGGHGEHSLEFARRGLRPIMQDRPEVIEGIERRGDLASAGVELFAGDLLTTLPQGPFDLVFCSAVTNMFDETKNRDLYRRLRPRIAPGGGLAIISYMRDRSKISAAFGLQMLVWTDGGDAHAADDYRRWLSDADYGPIEVHDLDDPPQTVLLAEKISDKRHPTA